MTETRTHKPCKRCGQLLPLSAFGTHKKTAPNGKKYDFRRNMCKPCYSEYIQERRRATGQRVKPYKSWSDRRKEQHHISNMNRRSKQASLPAGFTRKDWKQALDAFGHKCAYCGKPLTKAHQDHFVPLKLGGGYTKRNIIPSCPKCNLDKRDKNPLEWLKSKAGGLLAYYRVRKYLESV